jgi:hypothetical protein
VSRLVIALVLLVVAVVVAVILRRRRPEPPTQATWDVPSQLDRDDFDRPDTPWLLAVFTSATCESCEGALTKAAPLAGADVAFQEISWQTRRDLHERYRVETVPMILLADPDGVVRASFIGTPPTADLWAAVAEARRPPVG